MEKLALPENRGYLIAGIGGIEALLAFLFMPYVSIPVAYNGGVSITFSAMSDGGLIWVEVLLALLAIAIPALVVYRNNPFGLSGTPVETQVRWGIYTLIGIGALGLLAQLIVVLNVGSFGFNGQTLGSANSITNISYSTGFWFYLLSMIAVVAGGGLAFRKKIAPASSLQSLTPPTQYPPYH